MSSGIFSYFEDPLFLEAVVQDPGRRWMPDTCIKIGLSHPLYFNPGAGWHYSQTNTYILGRLIEKLTGNSLTDEIYTRIVAPLGLVNTNLIDYGTTLPGVHGRGYYAGTYEEGADVTEYLDASTLWAAGSAYSTPRELQKYVEKLVGGGFLPDSLQQLRLQDHFISCDMFSEYGLCLSRRGTFYGNYGDMPGFNTAMYHSNAKNCTVIISFNCQLNVKTEYLFYRFMDILYGKDF
jgi:D-alanyl-D-alanine carboxypeptidase